MRLAVEKQAEADQLFAQARQEKDKHKQDSLHALAQKIQLVADNLKAKEKQLQAESKARQLEIIKEKEARQFEKEARQFQLYLLYLALVALLAVTLLAYFIFLAQQKEKKAKELITAQKEEISQQKEEINQQRDFLSLQAHELETANQTKDKLFAILGHDLRSPIGSLESVLNLMNMGLVSYQEFQIFMPQFHKNVKNMQTTLENLLQWSITQMQGLQAYPTEVILAQIVDEKIQLFGEIAKTKNITLCVEVLKK